MTLVYEFITRAKESILKANADLINSASDKRKNAIEPRETRVVHYNLQIIASTWFSMKFFCVSQWLNWFAIERRAAPT